MKKFAVRAMVALCIIVALCIFFSGTVRTITTPKVRFTAGKTGKFKSETEMTGKLYFKNIKEYTADIPEGQSLKVKKVSVKAGDAVKSGDKLFTSTVVDYDRQMEQLKSSYESTQHSLLELARKNSSIKLTRNENLWMEAFYQNRDASRAYLEARVEVNTLLRLAGLKLPAEGYPEGAGDELKAAIDTMRAKEAEYRAAAEKLSSLNRYAIDDAVWSVLTQQKEYEEKLEKAENDMTALAVLALETATVKADSKYYIIELSTEKGAVITSDTVLFKYSTDSLPYIKADITNIKEIVSEGSAVSVNTSSYGWIEGSVVSTGSEPNGTRYALIEVSTDIQNGFGGLSNMLTGDIKLRLTTRSKESTCLIPSSAVRGSGSDRYVFTAEKSTSPFGGTKITVRKVSVTVLNESAGTVSIQEDLGYSQIIYGEDRQIKEGDTVMEYSK